MRSIYAVSSIRALATDVAFQGIKTICKHSSGCDFDGAADPVLVGGDEKLQRINAHAGIE